MADKPKPLYFTDKLGHTVKTEDPATAESVQADPSKQIVSEREAPFLAAADRNLSYVDQNWGTPVKLGLGALSGLTLGLGPGIASSLGLINPEHVRAAQTSSSYMLGDVGGMALPAIFGGELLELTPAGLLGQAGNAAEGLSGRLLTAGLGESGAIGRLASTPLKMAARGATEGALIGLGHQAGENLLDNKELSAEAWAAMTGGALFGGLLGAGIGTVGALGEQAARSVGSFAEKSVNTGKIADGLISRRLGLTTQDVETKLTRGETGLKDTIKGYGSVLSDAGVKVSDDTETILKATREQKVAYKAARDEALEALEKSDAQMPSPARIEQSLRNSLGDSPEVDAFMAKYAPKAEPMPVVNLGGTPANDFPANDFAPPVQRPVHGDPVGWAKTDRILETLGGENAPTIRRIMRAEMEESAKAADKALAEKMTAAVTQKAIAEELETNLVRKLAKETMDTSPSLSPRDYASAAISGAFGHPLVGLTLLAAKSAGRQLERRFEPAIAEYAFNSSIGAKAAGATSDVKSRIAKSLGKVFKGGATAATRGGTSAAGTPTKAPTDRRSYESAVSRVETLLSRQHQSRLADYANQLASSGYPGLASAILSNNNRAVQYMMYNMPPRAGSKGMKSLGKTVIPHLPSLPEYKFGRQVHAANDPMDVIDRIADGDISRDEIQTIKYIYPELHKELISQAAEKIYEMKVAGESLPVSKIAALGTALDAPVDAIMEPEYINGIQAQYQPPPPPMPVGMPGPTAPMAPQAMPMDMSAVSGLMTQTQRTQSGMT